MRTHSWYILALILGAASMGAVRVVARAVENPLPANSLWVGQLDQSELDLNQNELLDAALWIQSEEDDKRTGVFWFPSVEMNGKKASSTALFKVNIQLREKGVITWSTLDVLYNGGGKWDKGVTDGSITKDKLTTQSKVDGKVVKMNLKRVKD